MWLRLPTLTFSIVFAASNLAVAQPALDDAGSPTPPAKADPDTPVKTRVEWGFGIRVRGVFIPKAEIELFVDRAGDNGSRTLGLGLEFARRRGNTELQIGIEFEGFNPGSGVWIEKDKPTTAGSPADVVLARDDQPKKLGWVTFEFTFLNHAPLTKNLAIRYGGGAGLGIVLGELRHYDVTCSGQPPDAKQSNCSAPVPPFNGSGTFESSDTPVKYNLPPVFPVVNAIIGLQFKPIDKLTINLEGGIRTFLFFGLSSSYFF